MDSLKTLEKKLLTATLTVQLMEEFVYNKVYNSVPE